MKGNRSLLLSSLATVGIFATGATDPAEARELPDPSRDLDRLLGVIKPQTGESPFTLLLHKLLATHLQLFTS